MFADFCFNAWDQITNAYPGLHDLLSRSCSHLYITNAPTLAWVAAGAPTWAQGMTYYTDANLPAAYLLAKGLPNQGAALTMVRRELLTTADSAGTKLYGKPVRCHKEWWSVWNHYPQHHQAWTNPAEYLSTAAGMRMEGGGPAQSLYPDVLAFVEKFLFQVNWIRSEDLFWSM